MPYTPLHMNENIVYRAAINAHEKDLREKAERAIAIERTIAEATTTPKLLSLATIASSTKSAIKGRKRSTDGDTLTKLAKKGKVTSSSIKKDVSGRLRVNRKFVSIQGAAATKNGPGSTSDESEALAKEKTIETLVKKTIVEETIDSENKEVKYDEVVGDSKDSTLDEGKNDKGDIQFRLEI